MLTKSLMALSMCLLFLLPMSIPGQGLELNARGDHKMANAYLSGLTCTGYVAVTASVVAARPQDWPSSNAKEVTLSIDYWLSDLNSPYNQEYFYGRVPVTFLRESSNKGIIGLVADTTAPIELPHWMFGSGVLIDLEWIPNQGASTKFKNQYERDTAYYLYRQSSEGVSQSVIVKGTIQGAGLGVCQILGSTGEIGDVRIHTREFLLKTVQK